MKRRVLSLFAVSLFFFCSTIHVAEAAERVTMADFSFESSQLHNRIVGFLLKEGYGLKPDYLFSSSMPAFMGLDRGDVDLILDSWVDNIPDWLADVRAKGTVFEAGKVCPDAPQGWYVPAYLVKGDPERGIEPLAPDLKTVDDLKKYWDLFKDRENPKKGRFYNAPSAWKCHVINLEKIKAYGLDETYESFDPGSHTAQMTEILSAFKRGKPILFYHWEPTTLMGMVDAIQLKEPPFDPDHWGEGKDYGCAYQATRVMKLANAKWADKHPEEIKLICTYTLPLTTINKMLARMDSEKLEADEVALLFLKENPDLWKSWVQDEERIAKIQKALDKK